jgi:hypothetical protein
MEKTEAPTTFWKYIYIYGPFDGQAIETVSGPAHPRKVDERAIARIVKQYLVKAGKNWVNS